MMKKISQTMLLHCKSILLIIDESGYLYLFIDFLKKTLNMNPKFRITAR